MTTPALLPCPFCGGTACLDDSVGGAFVSCELCEAQGPFVEWERVDYPESMLLKKQAIQKAQAAAAAAWNQRSAWQPIETAPADGTQFLAWDGKDMKRAIAYSYGCIYDDEMESPYLTLWHPTHWQPLPSPPPITP